MRGGRATQRCHNCPRWRNGVTGCEWRHAPEARGGLWEIWRKLESWKTRRRTRRFDFWGSLRRDEFARRGIRTRSGAKWIRRHSEIVSLSPYVETFNSKLIKRFHTWTRSPYVFSNFEIPMFFICSIVMNIICLFRTWR